MTTLEPGASVVFTQGRRCSPRSTAFLASRAAPIITDGLDVLVHEVIAAITTAPWSISVSVPSSSVTFVGLDARPGVGPGATASGTTVPLLPTATGSLAGNVSATPSSTLVAIPSESA
jgi:hypothetical protein